MATTYKKFQPNDIANSRTLLHESIPLTGTLMSGTYGSTVLPTADDENIKTYTHGMFQSVYDYPYLSSSANQIFDITVGYHAAVTASGQVAGLPTASQEKRQNIYNSMAQVLTGYDQNNVMRKFDEDGALAEGSKYNKVLFVNFSRLLYKDEIKKGSFSMQWFCSGAYDHPQGLIKIADKGAATDYKINSPAGEFGILYVTEQNNTALTTVPTTSPQDIADQFSQVGANSLSFAGLIFYQAGVAVFPVATGTIPDGTAVPATSSVNSIFSDFGPAQASTVNTKTPQYSGSLWKGALRDLVASGTVDDWADNFRMRVYNMQFNNTTELHSSIYFCRANHNDFNYSSNPTYTTSSKMRVKTDNTDEPISYITTVGLYSEGGELMATAKLSEALKKTPSTELVLRVRLDY